MILFFFFLQIKLLILYNSFSYSHLLVYLQTLLITLLTLLLIAILLKKLDYYYY